MGCRCRVSCAARLRVLLQVQRSGVSGSPRVSGSIRRSRAPAKRGSWSVIFLSPAPACPQWPGGGARTIGRDGFDEEDIAECILALMPGHFYKATRSDRNPEELPDVYKTV